MKPCEYFEELIGAAADGEITCAEETELREHMENCEHCRSFYNALRAVSEIDSVLPGTPESFTDAVMTRVRETAAAASAKKKAGVIRIITRYGMLAAAAAVIIWAGVSFGGTAAPQSTDSAAPAALYEESESETASVCEETAAEEASAEAADNEPPAAFGVGSAPQSDETAENGARAVNDAAQICIEVNTEDGGETTFTDDGFFADYFLTGEETAVPERDADYTLTFTSADGTESSYRIWADGSEVFWQADGTETAYLSPASPETLEQYLERP